jgi:hypothetical protein
MQDLKAEAVLFLTRDEAGELDRAAGKILARCEIDRRPVESPEAGPKFDIMIRSQSDVIEDAKRGDAAGRIENAVREAAGPDRVRFLQWVETEDGGGPRPASAAGDAAGGRQPVEHSPAGHEPQPVRHGQGHGSAQAPEQPGDRSGPNPPNPRR